MIKIVSDIFPEIYPDARIIPGICGKIITVKWTNKMDKQNR